MIILLIKWLFIVGLGLFASFAFIECVEQKRIRKDRQRVQAVVRGKYPRVY
jgi:hypothetical protein